jgi:hypothetical protein
MSSRAPSKSKKRKCPTAVESDQKPDPPPSMRFALKDRARSNGPSPKIIELLSKDQTQRVSVLVVGKQILCSATDADLVRNTAWSYFQPLLTSKSALFDWAKLSPNGEPYEIRVALPCAMPWPNNISPLVGKRFIEDKKAYSVGGGSNFAFFHHGSTKVTILTHQYVPKCCTKGCEADIDMFLALLTFDASDAASCQDAILRLGVTNSLATFQAALKPFLKSGKVPVLVESIEPWFAHRLEVSEFFLHVSRPHEATCCASMVGPWSEDTFNLRKSWIESKRALPAAEVLQMPTWANAVAIEASLPAADHDQEDPTTPLLDQQDVFDQDTSSESVPGSPNPFPITAEVLDSLPVVGSDFLSPDLSAVDEYGFFHPPAAKRPRYEDASDALSGFLEGHHVSLVPEHPDLDITGSPSMDNDLTV